MDDLIKFNKTLYLKDWRGAQDFEKIALLKAQYIANKNTKQPSALNSALATFNKIFKILP